HRDPPRRHQRRAGAGDPRRTRVRPTHLPTHDDRRRAQGRRAREKGLDAVAIFVDETTKVVFQGLTGSQGRFYGLRNREYGTQVVAGTNPKKAGTDVDGIPIYASVKEASKATGATVSCVFIPAPGV